MKKTQEQPAMKVTRSIIEDIGEVPLIKVGSMTRNEMEERLSYFGRRAKSLCGRIMVKDPATGHMVSKPLAEEVSHFFDTLLASTSDAKVIAQRNEFFAKVESGDPVAKAQFASARLEQFNNFLMARLDWINQYAEVITLGADEWPAEQNTLKTEVTCGFVGEKGTPKLMSIQKDDVERRIPIRLLTTPVIRYTEMDLYRGDIVSAALQTLNLTFDLANKKNYEFFQIVLAGFTPAWDFTNAKKARWPFITNSYIDQNNLPAGNDVTVTGAAAGVMGSAVGTYFDFSTLDEIIDWCARWNGLSPEGDLRPTGRIRLPSSHLKFFGKAVTPTGSQNNKVADDLLEKGWTGVKYRGVDWVFIPDSTLSSTSYYAYPEFNLKPAKLWRKTGKPWERDVTRTGEQDRELFDSGEQERQVRTNYAAAINYSNLRKFARFKYKL
jgi:hypothetical protein